MVRPVARTAAHEMFDRDLASRSLGIELLDVGPGRARMRMPVTEAMVNGHAVTHGGYVFLLADTAFACACNSHGPVTVAAGADITFLRTTRAGDVLVAVARERARQGRSGIYDVTVTRDDEVVAEFRGRSRVIGGPANGEATPGDSRTGDPRTGGPRNNDPRTGDPRTGDPAPDSAAANPPASAEQPA